MSVNSEENKDSETTLERTKRIIAEIEEMIFTTGEHPEYELKKTWQRNNHFLKAEFIKDIQSIANSSIASEKEKFIIVGADEGTRQITGCDHSEFDEASIRQLLESHLDSVPNYEILYPKATNGKDYVVLRIPHQTRKPFIVKLEIIGDKNQRHLTVGEVWLKPSGSTGKRRLASREDLLAMIDIDALVQKEVEYRLSQLIPEIRKEERTRIGSVGFGAVPSLTSTEEEFELYVEQIIASNDAARFNVLLQKLRDKCVESWELKIDKSEMLTLEEMREEKELTFLPAMRRLALLGILIIKYEAPLDWFNKIADLLIDIFKLSDELSAIVPYEVRQQKAESLETHLNNYVPALESLMIANILIGYEIKKKSSVKFSSKFFPRLVTVKFDSYYSSGEHQMFYLFYPFYDQTVDRRMDLLIMERYGDADKILSFFGNESSMTKTLLQVIFLIDWLSFLSFEKLTNEPQTANYFNKQYPNINTAFIPVYTRESLQNIAPLAKKIWADLPLGEKNYFLLDSNLAEVISTFNVDKRKELFARFLIEAERLHAERMLAQRRFPFDIYWSEEINSIIQSIRELKNK